MLVQTRFCQNIHYGPENVLYDNETDDVACDNLIAFYEFSDISIKKNNVCHMSVVGWFIRSSSNKSIHIC